MSVQSPPYPEFPIIRAYAKRCNGWAGMAAAHRIDPRTAQRIYSGKWKPGPNLMAELLAAANA